MDTDARIKQFKDLPGPRGLPLLGNVLQFDPSQIQKALERWADEYGCPYRIKLASEKAVVISDPDMVREALRDRPERFRRFESMETISRDLGIFGVFPAEGEDWRRQRRAWMQALNFHQVKPFHARLTRTTERLKNRWDKAAVSGESVDVLADLMRYTVDVTTQFAFGYDTNTLENDDNEIRKHLSRIFNMLSRRITFPIHYWKWFKLPGDRALDKSLIEVRKFADTMIQDARQRIDKNPDLASKPTNLIEAMLVSRDEDGSKFSDDEIYANAIIALLAGEDTTANTMAWMIHMLTTHPEVQLELQDEVDNVLAGQSLLTGLEDGQRLTYLDALTSETMRLKPVAPLIFLCAREDTVLGKVRLQKGTNVILALRHLSTRQSEYKDPLVFDPDRWLRDKKQRIENMAPMPFGGGPRMCPGRNLAQMEIKSVIAMLARNFEVEAVNADQVSERFSFTMMPRDLLVNFKKRNVQNRQAA